MMGATAPVAVLIPFHGPVEPLRKSLQSLAHETVEHDVVVVDDGNPSPLTIPSDWHRRAVVIRHSHNRGITAALNTGLEHIRRSHYRYAARLDAGDFVIAGRLKKQVAYLENAPDCMLLGGAADFVAEDGRRIFLYRPPCTAKEIRRALHRQCCFLHPTVMFRVAVFAELGGYRDIYPAAEDYDLFMRIAARFPTANLPDPVLEYLVTPNSISSQRRRTQVISRLRIVLAHFDPLLRQSYEGVVQSLISLALPRSATVHLHRIHGSLARTFAAR